MIVECIWLYNAFEGSVNLNGKTQLKRITKYQNKAPAMYEKIPKRNVLSHLCHT